MTNFLRFDDNYFYAHVKQQQSFYVSKETTDVTVTSAEERFGLKKCNDNLCIGTFERICL